MFSAFLGTGYWILVGFLVFKAHTWSVVIFFIPLVSAIIANCGVNLGRLDFIFKAITAFGILIFVFNYYEFGVYGLMLILTGMASNAIVAASNRFYMPARRLDYIHLFEMLNRGYIEMGSNTRLNMLGDWIEVEEGFISIGDVLILIGAWVAILELCFF